MIDDCDLIWLTDIFSARAELSGCADWFATPDAYNDACDLVWRAADRSQRGFSGYTIERERAGALMEAAAEAAAA